MRFKILLLISVISTTCLAQDTRVFHPGIGIRLGFPYTVLDVTNSVGIGAELQGEVEVGTRLTVPLAVGYIQFPGKTISSPFGDLKHETVRLIPLLGGLRFYPSEKFFIGGRLGFTLGTNNRGGFPLGYLWEPQLGINGRKAQVFAGFDGVDGLRYGFFTLGGILKL